MNLPLYPNQYTAYYHGEGNLILEGGRYIHCLFEACQIINGRIFLLCKFDQDGISPFACNKSDSRFEGRTSEGYLIFGNGEFNAKKRQIGCNGNFILYLISSLYITEDGNSMAAKVVFGLTNLNLNNSEIQLDLTAKGADDQKVTLKPLKNFEAVIDHLDAFNDINVTYEAVIDISREEDFQPLEQMIQDLCYLLSIACGTKINWIYLDRYNEAGRVISRYLHNRITRRYNSSALIRIWDMKKFIECTYPNYIEKKDLYKLDRGLIGSYLDAKSQGDYLEMRAAKLAISIEFLKSVLMELPEYSLRSHFIEQSYFEDQLWSAPLIVDR